MGSSISKSERRAGIILNYVSVLLLVVLFYLGKADNWSIGWIVAEAAALVVALITLLRYHFLTGLWRLVHTKVTKLDERQVHITHESLRHSYSIFTVLALLVLLWKAVFQSPDPNLIIVFAALLYLAHTLPSTVLAWTETEV